MIGQAAHTVGSHQWLRQRIVDERTGGPFLLLGHADTVPAGRVTPRSGFTRTSAAEAGIGGVDFDRRPW